MTAEEAIKFIREEIQIDVQYADVPKTEKALQTAISALEKQISKKPDRPRRVAMGNEYDDYRCTCGRWLCYEPQAEDMIKDITFCPSCGQAICWEE